MALSYARNRLVHDGVETVLAADIDDIWQALLENRSSLSITDAADVDTAGATTGDFLSLQSGLWVPRAVSDIGSGPGILVDGPIQGVVNIGVIPVDVQELFTAGTFTWVKPQDATIFQIELCGGGGSGAAGHRGAAGTDAAGGGGGGPGAYTSVWVLASALPDTVTVTAGAGGAGVPGISADGNGTAGNAGAGSTFGTGALNVYFNADGGAGASASTTTSSPGGAAGLRGTDSGAAGAAGSNAIGAVPAGNFLGFTIAGASGQSLRAPWGGSSGGGFTAANAVSNGAIGTQAGFVARAINSAAGTTTGSRDATDAGFFDKWGASGAGGATSDASATVPAGSGGDGSRGNGGGGGGAARTGSISGAGGKGGDGWARITGFTS